MKPQLPSFMKSGGLVLLLVAIGFLIARIFPSIGGAMLFLLLYIVLLIMARKPFAIALTSIFGTRHTNTFLFSEEYEKAVLFATKQISRNPKDVVGFLTRSTAYIHLGNLDAARADCEAALKLDPQSVYTLNNRAVISMQQDNLPTALADMQQALSLQPDNPVLLYGRGVVYARMDNDEAAQKDFEAAIELDPDQAATYIGRGHLKFKRGAIRAAYDDYKKACDLSPETHQFIAAFAVAEFECDDKEYAQSRWHNLPTRFSNYSDADWLRRVLNWPRELIVSSQDLETSKPLLAGYK